MKNVIIFIIITGFWNISTDSYCQNTINKGLDSINITINSDFISSQKSYIYLFPDFNQPIDSILLKFGENKLRLKFHGVDLFAISYKKQKKELFFILCEKNVPLYIEYRSQNESMYLPVESSSYENWKNCRDFISSTFQTLGRLTNEAGKKNTKEKFNQIGEMRAQFMDSIYHQICLNPYRFTSLYALTVLGHNFPEYKKFTAFNTLSKELQEHRLGKIVHDKIDSLVFVNINDILSASSYMIDSCQKIKPPDLIDDDSTHIVVHFWRNLNDYGIKNTQYIDSLLESYSSKHFIYISVFIGDEVKELTEILIKNHIKMRTYIIPSKYYSQFCRYTQDSSLPHDIIFTNKNRIHQRFLTSEDLISFLNKIQ